MQITTEEHKSALIIHLEGHLSHVSVADVEHFFDKWIAKGRLNFIMDMAALQYVNSAGLRCLLTMANKINGLNGKLLLCGMQAEVKQIFDVSGFTTLFSIHDTAASALKHI